VANQADLFDKVVNVFADLTSNVPVSSHPRSDDPARQARHLTLKASSEAALLAGALALPPGPLGMLTVLPDLVLVWKLQRQLVADIAATYGRSDQLVTETMIYCLFRHAAAQVVRDFAVRSAERVLIQRAPLVVIQRTLKRVGVVISKRVAGRTLSRWLPLAGAIGIGAYAFYDTAQVGKTAQQLFDRELTLVPALDSGRAQQTSEAPGPSGPAGQRSDPA